MSIPSPIPHSDGLTGGVCKEQGRIHRAMLKRDYYGFQLHEGGFQPSIRTSNGFVRFTCPFGFVSHCPAHCSPRVAQEIRGILIYRSPHLPLISHQRSPQSTHLSEDTAGNCGHGSRSLPDLTGCFTVRTGDDHAPPLSDSGKVFSLTYILLSPLVSFPALSPIKPQAPPVVVLPRQFL